MRRPRLRLLVAVALAILPSAAVGAAQLERTPALADAAQCYAAIYVAAHATGVPARLLLALAPTESGISSRVGHTYPWPWTLNANGFGSYHFRSRAAAERYLRKLIEAGADNIDIGCMQINWHWHGRVFASPAAALEPTLNVRYAAELLRLYRAQTGSWAGAVGWYHSRDPHLADAYRCRVARALQPTLAVRGCSSG